MKLKEIRNGQVLYNKASNNYYIVIDEKEKHCIMMGGNYVYDAFFYDNGLAGNKGPRYVGWEDRIFQLKNIGEKQKKFVRLIFDKMSVKYFYGFDRGLRK